MTDETLPTSPETINAFYLEAHLEPVLGWAPSEIDDVAYERLSRGTSGDALYAVRALADGQAVEVILKLNSAAEATEALFYRDLARDVAADTPRVADARLLPDGRGWSLIESLRPKDDLTWTENEYRAIVEDMAAMHAGYWNSATLDRIDWLWRPTPDALDRMMTALGGVAGTMLDSGVPAVLRTVFPTPRLQRIAGVLARWEDHAGPLLDAGTTFVHGDYWFHNVLVTDEGRRALIDWQGCRIFSGIWEICYFVDLLRVIDTTHYRDLPLPEATIATWYLDALRTGGVSLSKEQFAPLYRHAQILQPLVHWLRQVGQFVTSGGTELPVELVTFLEEEFERWDRVAGG